MPLEQKPCGQQAGKQTNRYPKKRSMAICKAPLLIKDLSVADTKSTIGSTAVYTSEDMEHQGTEGHLV